MVLPQVHLKGLYVVANPFKLEEATAYECASVVLFTELALRGIDVFSTYYDAYNISETVYEADAANGGAIVTLTSPGNVSVTLPASYITSFPSGALVPYNLFILSANLTAPDNEDFSALIEAMQVTIESKFGIKDAEVSITQVPTLSYMTAEDAKIAENNRQAAITDKSTLRAEVSRLQDKNQALALQVESLTQALIESSNP